jgi:hypothetical protein
VLELVFVHVLGTLLFSDTNVIEYVPPALKTTVATFPLPLLGLAPLLGLTFHVIVPGLPPVAVNVTLCPTIEL